MKLGYELNLKQTQNLIMTPELQQAINILQLSTLELNQFLEEQIVENPLLEPTGESITERLEVKEKDYPEWEEYFNDGRDLGIPREKKERVKYENFLSQETILVDFLEEQLRYSSIKAEEHIIGQFIIGNLDSKGYFILDTNKAIEKLGITIEQFMKVLKLVQSFEPSGIAARDLSECLEIQLKNQGKWDEIYEKILDKYLEAIAKGRTLKVAGLLDISVQKLQEYIDSLKKLNPKPGASFFTNQKPEYIIPDMLIEKREGEYVVIVNDFVTPRLRISNAYKRILSSGNADDITKGFIEKKIQSALWLIKSIEQRRITLYKIAQNLIKRQREFLDKGSKYLCPLTLKDVAEDVDVHESTVSRAIANKYVQTPHGVYPLKYFFSGGIETKEGEKISTQSIKKILEELIEQENPKKPYSDQKLCDLLRNRGIKIARRTVSKYREELGILSTIHRKRY